MDFVRPEETEAEESWFVQEMQVANFGDERLKNRASLIGVAPVSWTLYPLG